MNKKGWLVFCLVLQISACSRSLEPVELTATVDTAHTTSTTNSSNNSPLSAITPEKSRKVVDDPLEGENKVLFIFGDGFDYRHYDGTRTALERAGYQIIVASNTLGPIEGHITVHGFEIVSRHGQTTPIVNVDLLLEDVQVSNYLGIVFISDAGTLAVSSPELQLLLQSAAYHGVVLAAQEYGIYLLADAGLLGGKKVTANPLICREMEVNYNAICTLMPVQRDDGIITADPTMSTVSFARSIMGEIEEKKP